MSISTALPYSWLRSLPPDIKTLDKIPLWGEPPPFPWEPFTQALNAALHIEGLKIQPTNTQWKNKDEIASGLGDKPIVLAFQVTPLKGKCYWMLPHEELKGLLSLTISSGSELTDLENDEWEREFYEFLALEAANAFQKVKFDPTLTPQLVRDEALPDGAALCIDVELKTPQKTFTGRLAITSEMLDSLRQKYTPKTLQYPQGLAEVVSVTLHLVAGQVELTRKEWDTINLGDFLILDSCSITPGEDKGRIVLTMDDNTLFRGKIKDGNIKILEYPLLHEVKSPMAKEEEFEEEDFETEEGSLTHEEEGEEEVHEEEEFAEEELEEEEHEEEHEEPLEEEGEEEEHPPATKAAAKIPSEQAPPSALTKPDQIPLTVKVEVGRIQMSLKQLMELAPGNVLEMNVRPEDGVDLIINGRCIGKGELLKIGEAIGVRILDKA